MGRGREANDGMVVLVVVDVVVVIVAIVIGVDVVVVAMEVRANAKVPSGMGVVSPARRRPPAIGGRPSGPSQV